MDLAGVSVLVVEDDPDARQLLAVVLEYCGATAHAAASVKDALAVCDEAAPAVVVSDLSMPGADGYAFLAAFRRDSARANVPVIALTGYSHHRDRALAAGFSDFLVKPVDPEQLCERVRHHLDA